jgi:hypothetical protein
MFDTIDHFGPALENYSINEAFHFDGGPQVEEAYEIR